MRPKSTDRTGGVSGTVASLAVTCVLILAASSAFSLDLNAVLQKTLVSPPARVEFREERHNQLLKEPLILYGYLEYLEEGRLRKVVESPFEEAFLIDNGNIEVQQKGKTRRISLSRSKTLKTMLEGIESILAGQSERLASIFRYELSGTDNSWNLRLTPLSERIAKHLTSLLVSGDQKSITSIRFDLKDGEWHQMDLQHIRSER